MNGYFFSVILSICLMFCGGTLQANLLVDTTIVFNENVHDFGTLPQGQLIEYEFEFKNTAAESLILLDVRSTCRNLKIEWPKTEIPAGETAKLKIRFKTQEALAFEKKIIVYSTGEPSPMILIIKGIIKK